jgi:ATP-dependent 26S proteasome regulatory subunit
MMGPPTSLYIGSSSIPILFAEVIPIELGATSVVVPPLSNFGVKQFLLRETDVSSIIGAAITGNNVSNESQLFIRWKEESNNKDGTVTSGYIFQNQTIASSPGSDDHVESSTDQEVFPLVYIPSDDPTIIDGQPCCIIAYTYRDHLSAATCRELYDREDSSMCYFVRGTLIRMLPPRLAVNLPGRQSSFRKGLDNNTSLNSSSQLSSFYLRRELMLNDLLGEEGSTNTISDSMEEEVLQNHNQQTIDELYLKLSTTMIPIRIGTTRDAFRVQKEQERQLIKIKQSIQAFCCESTIEETIHKTSTLPRNNKAGLQLWPSLIVHSPNHGDGKTLLVQAIVKKRLGCSSIHVVRPGALLAKYGIRADAALESQLHAIIVSTACRNQSICIILDQLDTMMPPRLSGRSSSGDSALPVLNSMASYLRKITTSLQRNREWPFPTKNPLYNPTACSSSGNAVFTVNVCLVGIVTCPDDGWRSSQKSKNGSIGDSGSTILDCMVGDRYRIPLLTAKTVLSAFHAAFTKEGIILEASARTRLSVIVASAAWAKGSVFRSVARQLKQILIMSSKWDDSTMSTAFLQDLEKAIALTKINVTNSAQVNIQTETEIETSLKESEDKSPVHFVSIGGNEQAKVSLEDALAFDPAKRDMLSRFGLSPPTGVLLYGPPGTGKTLLAKAVARMLKDPSSGEPGGTFMSLSVSEIVSAEVGTSEKMIASSFEFAEKNAPSVSYLCQLSSFFFVGLFFIYY